jgi:hypothetical protein
MKYPLREARLAERVLAITLKDDDGLVRRCYRLSQDGAGQPRRLRAEVIHTQPRRCSGLTASRLDRPEVRA